MLKCIFLMLIILSSSVAFADNINKPLYTGKIFLISIKMDNEKTDELLNLIYDNYPQERTPIDILSSYGKILNHQEIAFSNIEQDKTTLLNKNEKTDNYEGLILEMSVFKNKNYTAYFSMYSYDDGSSENFGQDMTEINSNYITLNGFITYYSTNENEKFYTFAFLKLEK